jgi:fluoride ion exporter CrcB/FEX
VTPVVFVLAAAIGAVARLLIGLTVCSWQALLVANTTGAVVLGYVSAADLSASTITTYSSFALEARSLGWRWGAFYAALTIGCACAAASIGSTFA